MPRVTAFRSEKIKKLLLDLLQGGRYEFCRGIHMTECSVEGSFVFMPGIYSREEPLSAVNLVPSDEQENNKNKHNPRALTYTSFISFRTGQGDNK